MSYDAAEGRLQTLLQGLTSTFANTAQVVRANWQVLDKGYANVAVIYPGGVASGDHWTSGGDELQWDANIRLFTKFLYDGTSVVTLIQMRDAVIQLLQKYPTLNALGNYAVGAVTGDEFVELGDKDGNGAFWLSTTLKVNITELSVVSGGEV